MLMLTRDTEARRCKPWILLGIPWAAFCMLFLASGCEQGMDTSEESTTTERTTRRIDSTDDTPDNDPDLENTARNERDEDGDTLTPFDQSNDQDDIDLVAEIRAEVLEIDDLTVNGQNVKIITNDGRVVLRGPVHSAAERDAIVAVAEEIAGADKVTDQLEVDNEDEGEL
jgi:hyperosmotically inducible periplasmic protein